MPFRGQVVYRLNRWLWTGIDWLYPPHCGGCQNQGARWCLECQSKTELISGFSGLLKMRHSSKRNKAL